jgi:predicted transcriptional regulator
MLGTDEPLLRLTSEEREEVRATLPRGDLSPRVRERLEMVKAADLGHGLQEIAAWSGRKPRTVRRWLVAFASGGIGALADAPRSGRPAVADAAYLSLP